MPSMQVYITPWRDQAELLQVKDSFFNPAAGRARRQEACELVRAWELLGATPHAVVATAELTNALLFDDDGGVGSRNRNGNIDGMTTTTATTTATINHNTVMSRLGVYMSAWTRFVDGMTDSQQVLRVKRSMYEIARELGMPTTFIELRHRAVHEQKPSLREFRHETRLGLAWLYTWFWSHVLPLDDDDVVNDDDDDDDDNDDVDVDMVDQQMNDGNANVNVNVDIDVGVDIDDDAASYSDGKKRHQSYPEQGLHLDLERPKSSDSSKTRETQNEQRFRALFSAEVEQRRLVDKLLVASPPESATMINATAETAREEDDIGALVDLASRYCEIADSYLPALCDCILSIILASKTGDQAGSRRLRDRQTLVFIPSGLDPLLLGLADRLPFFPAVFIDALIRDIAVPSPKQSDQLRQRISAVLAHIHTSPSWDRLCDLGIVNVDVLRQVCSEHPNGWTQSLLEALKNG